MRLPKCTVGKPEYLGIYILEESGDRNSFRTYTYKNADAKLTDAKVFLYYSDTDSGGHAAIYKDKTGFYIRNWARRDSAKRPSKLRLENFAVPTGGSGE